MSRDKLEPAYGNLEKQSVINMFANLGNSLFSVGLNMSDKGLKRINYAKTGEAQRQETLKKNADNSEQSRITDAINNITFGLEGTNNAGFFNEIINTSDTSKWMDLLNEGIDSNLSKERIQEITGVSDDAIDTWWNKTAPTYLADLRSKMFQYQDAGYMTTSMNNYNGQVVEAMEKSNTWDEYYNTVKKAYKNTGMADADEYGTSSIDETSNYIFHATEFAHSRVLQSAIDDFNSGKFVNTAEKEKDFDEMLNSILKNLPTGSYTEGEIAEFKKDTREKYLENLRTEIAKEDARMRDAANTANDKIITQIAKEENKKRIFSADTVDKMFEDAGASKNPYLNELRDKAVATYQNKEFVRDEQQFKNWILLNPKATSEEISEKAYSIRPESEPDWALFVNQYIASKKTTEETIDLAQKKIDFELDLAKSGDRDNPDTMLKIANDNGLTETAKGTMYVKGRMADAIVARDTTNESANKTQYAATESALKSARFVNENITGEEIIQNAKQGAVYETTRQKKMWDTIAEEQDLILKLEADEITDEEELKNANKAKLKRDYEKHLRDLDTLGGSRREKWFSEEAVRLGIELTDEDLKWSGELSYEYETMQKPQVLEKNEAFKDFFERNSDIITKAVYNSTIKGNEGAVNTYYKNGDIKDKDASSVVADWGTSYKNFNVGTSYGNIVETLLPNGNTMDKAMLASIINDYSNKLIPKGAVVGELLSAILRTEECSNEYCTTLLWQYKNALSPDSYETYSNLIDKRTGARIDRTNKLYDIIEDKINNSSADKETKTFLKNRFCSSSFDKGSLFNFLIDNDVTGDKNLDSLADQYLSTAMQQMSRDETVTAWKKTLGADMYTEDDAYFLNHDQQMLYNYYTGVYSARLNDEVLAELIDTLPLKENLTTLAKESDNLSSRFYRGQYGRDVTYDDLTKSEQDQIDLHLNLALAISKQFEYARQIPEAYGFDKDDIKLRFFVSDARSTDVKICAVDPRGNMYVANGFKQVNIYKPYQYTTERSSVCVLNVRDSMPYKYDVFEMVQVGETTGYYGNTIKQMSQKVKNPKNDNRLSAFINDIGV